MTASKSALNEDAFRKLYLDAAKVDGKPGLYFIGPYGRRVSFASQQRRALNTVWALERAGKIQEGYDVAVVGGGLAGVTAATALAARKCSVWLYETRPRVLNLQAGTMHRFVHPTVNFWPEKDLDATTQFPFMDWYADVCAPILSGVRDEWVEYFKEHLTDVFTSTDVVKAVTAVDGAGMSTVTLSATGEGPAEQTFNAVLFATGFGAEDSVKGAVPSSYWEEDFLPERCATQKVLISGTGDGGLIDALRCVHRDFKRGRLAVSLAEMLDGTATKAKLKEAEATVQEQAGLDDDKAATLYKPLYESLLSKMSTKSRRFLDESLMRRATPVRLVGLLPTPFSMSAAPIHKVMIAHAIASGAVTYEQGTLVDGPILTCAGKPDEDMAGTECIARHGAKPPLHAILEPAEIEQLRSNQRLLADLIEGMPYDDSYWQNWGNYPARSIESVEFARFRLPLASQYVMSELKLRLALGLNRQSPVYLIGVDSGGATPTGGFPTSLFGIPTETRPAKVIDYYAE